MGALAALPGMHAARRKISPKKCQKCQKNGGKGSAGANQRTRAVGNPHPRHGSVHAPERVTGGTNRRTGPWETRVRSVEPGGDGCLAGVHAPERVTSGTNQRTGPWEARVRGVKPGGDEHHAVPTHRNASPTGGRELWETRVRVTAASTHRNASPVAPTGGWESWETRVHGIKPGVTGVLPASTHRNASPAAPTRGQVHGKPVSTVLSREVMDITRCPRTAPRHRCAQHPSPKQAGTAYRGSTRRPGRATPRAGR